jgi:hypothetical protein
LAIGYVMTAVFGLSMVVIGSQVGRIEGKGAGLVLALADQLQGALHPYGVQARVAFLVGSWGAIFSSLLGVWQSMPYLFADTWNLMRASRTAAAPIPVDARSRPYQMYLLGIATVPALGLLLEFQRVQKVYAVVGALCIPLLALALLALNGNVNLVGKRYRNPLLVTLLLWGTLVFFVLAGCLEIRNLLLR